jgi:hypothetical protein
MTPQDNFAKHEKALQTLEEICENTRAIRRVVNRILDQLQEIEATDEDNGIRYGPDTIDWEDFDSHDDMYS